MPTENEKPPVFSKIPDEILSPPQKPPHQKRKKTSKGPTTILSRENVSLALRMHAENSTPKEIAGYFESKNIPCPTYNSFHSMFKSKKYQAEIERYKEDYYSRISEVPIAHKRMRLEIRQKLITALEKKLTKILGQGGVMTGNRFKEFLKLSKQLEDLLAGAQDEMEKKPQSILMLTQNFGNKDLTMEELRNEERSVIGRIAELKERGISLPSRKT